MRRDGAEIGRTVSIAGAFTDFGLRPDHGYEYVVEAYDQAGLQIARSSAIGARTSTTSTIRTRYTVLAIAFNPARDSLVSETAYLHHRIQFLELASQRSALIDLYGGAIVSAEIAPPVRPGTTSVDYTALVTDRAIPGLGGLSIVDLIERHDIDHVWVVKTPAGAEFAENVLIGNRAIQGVGVVGPHSWIRLPVRSSRSFFVNGYLPDERAWDAYAHMVEGIMSSITYGHPEVFPAVYAYDVYRDHRIRENRLLERREINIWERFRLADGWNGTSPVAFASPGHSNAGSSHYLPTTPRTGGYDDYTYYDHSGPAWHRYVESEADFWLRYPQPLASTRKINGYEFGAFNNYLEGEPSYGAALDIAPDAHPSYRAAVSGFHQWWFAHLPHGAGVTGGALNNWWPYILDFNRFDGTVIDYTVKGFPQHTVPEPQGSREVGTDHRGTRRWGYWHSENGFSPGAKVGVLTMVRQGEHPQLVKRGQYALEVRVEGSQFWETRAAGRNDVFYPVSRDAHWYRPNLKTIRFSIRPGDNTHLITGTNPVIRLCRNAGTRIELVPVNLGVYQNRLQELALPGEDGWIQISAPVSGNAMWEKHVIGYIEPGLSGSEQQAAREQLEREILEDLNYIEISVRSTAPSDEGERAWGLSYLIDDLRLIDRR